LKKNTRRFFAPDLALTPPSFLPSQHATGRKGLFRTLLVEQKPLSIKKDFKPKAMMKENMPSEAAMQDTSVRDRKRSLFPRNVSLSLSVSRSLSSALLVVRVV
jgi:hypothetical protein